MGRFSERQLGLQLHWGYGLAGANMRVFFRKNGHICSAAFLTQATDAGRIDQAKKMFAAQVEQHHVDGFEIWEGNRFVYGYPEVPQPLQPNAILP